jgi:hypothetical protein
MPRPKRAELAVSPKPTRKPCKTSAKNPLTTETRNTRRAATIKGHTALTTALSASALSPATAPAHDAAPRAVGGKSRQQQQQSTTADDLPSGAGRRSKRRAQTEASGVTSSGKRRTSAQEQLLRKRPKKQTAAELLPRPQKQVRFAQGPLAAPAAGADGHPAQEGRVARPVRQLDSPFARGTHVTKKDVRELEDWLGGPEYEPSLTKVGGGRCAWEHRLSSTGMLDQASGGPDRVVAGFENGVHHHSGRQNLDIRPSPLLISMCCTQLKMRVGLLPAVPLVRPHATATRQRGQGS